jgi:hypothetical protein
MIKTVQEFRELSTQERLSYLRDHGHYLSFRFFGSFKVYLYESRGFYTEVWMRPNMDQVCWVEVADKDKVIENYTRNVKVLESLGL